MFLTNEELVRYNRQIIYRQFGEEGQKKLKKAHVIIAGLGGLGCTAAIYLTCAGVGEITIIDCETIELSNLNRQILHWTENIGQEKVISAAEKLVRLNPLVKIIPLSSKITKDNAGDIIKDSNVVIDALDNIETRLVLNEACFAKNVPLIHGGISGLYGQITTIIPGKTACLACIFPDKKTGQKPFPVFGITPAVIADFQCAEAIKLIANFGQLLENKMLYVDLANMGFYKREILKKKSCKVCGDIKEIH